MRKPTLRLAALVLAVWSAACSGGSPTERPKPDILLVSLDTVRADLLEPGPGGEPAVMPALRSFAERSLWYTNAFAPMAFTLPSHMTMMTGMHPESHGVSTQQDVLSPELITLPELLRARGFRTTGVICSSWLKASFGFGRGFDRYVELEPDLTYAERVESFVEGELRDRPPGGPPLFLFAHFFDAHSDFVLRDNRLTYYSSPSYRQGTEVPASAQCDAQGRCATDLLRFADREQRSVPPDEVAAHRELYRRGAQELDDRLHAFLTRVERSLDGRELVTVIVSDHGEEFREHGRFLHSQVYRESLHVPVLFRFSSGERAGRRDERPVGLADVAPTLLAYLGVSAPPAWQGRDLSKAPAASSAEIGASAALEVGQDKLTRTRYSLRHAGRLLVWDFQSGDGRWFDETDDPGARNALPIDRPEGLELRQRLFAALRVLRAARPPGARRSREAFSEEEKAVLRSLGYL